MLCLLLVLRTVSVGRFVCQVDIQKTNISFFRFTLDPTVSLRAVAERLPFTYTGADFYALCSDAMLKAVTRQATKVDAKIKQVNDSNNNEAATTETGGEKKRRQQPITTAYFFDHYATPEDIAVMVTEEDFLDAHRELIPSVSAGELAHYERVRATFEGGRGQEGSQQQQDSSSTPRQPQFPQHRKSSHHHHNNTTAPTAKGKGKAVAPPYPSYSSGSKGKGKAIATPGGDDNDDDEVEEGNDDYYGMEADGENTLRNGGGRHKDKGKGKGKAVAADAGEGGGFEQGRASDDEGLYD